MLCERRSLCVYGRRPLLGVLPVKVFVVGFHAASWTSEEGKQLYRQRQAIIEPVFAQTKHNRHVDRFQRRGLGAWVAIGSPGG